MPQQQMRPETRTPRSENSVPWFWPFEFAAAVSEQEISLFKRGLETITASRPVELHHQPLSEPSV